MTSCLLNKCCCYVDLRLGSLIVGYVNLVITFILLIISLLGLAAGIGVDNVQGQSGDHIAGFPKNSTAGIVVSVLMLIMVIVLFGASVVLLVGLHKRKRRYIKWYLIVAVVCVVWAIIVFLASFAGPMNFWGIVISLIYIIVSIYFIIVIRSYYHKFHTHRIQNAEATA